MEHYNTTTDATGEHQSQAVHQVSTTAQLQAPTKQALRGDTSAPPAKQHDGDADEGKLKESTSSTSPVLEVSLATGQDGQQEQLEFATSSIVATGPSARTFSPLPLLWSDGGWHAGHFAFDQGEHSNNEDKVKESRGVQEQEEEAPAPNKGREDANARKSSDEGSQEDGGSIGGSSASSTGSNSKEEATPRLKSATIPGSSIKTLRSTLTPTAAPFVFQPRSSSIASNTTPAPSLPLAPQLQPLVTSFPTSSAMPSQDFASSPGTYSSPTKSSYADTAFDYLQGEEETDWRLDDEGHLVQVGGGGDRYSIAEEILQLQSTDAAPTTTTMGYGGRVHTKLPSYYDQGRRASESSVSSSASSSFYPPRPQPPQIPFPTIPSSKFFPSTPPTAGGSSADRSRTSSISSQHSYFSPRASSSYDHSPSSAQLQSYFGPSSVEVNSPYTTAYDLAVSAVPPSPSMLRDMPSYGLHHSASCSSLSSLAYQTDPEDILYTEARETFIQSSFASLASTPTAANRQTMTAHFDLAMHSPFPLATLYGLTPEAATQLAADPARSGVAENVLKLALIRGQHQRLAGAAGLGGPSANNRKLGLYKTELCRSWEEKGSCRYGAKCQFAHGQHEVREVARHPKFKSEVCRTFWLHGSCPYGRRCCFIHTTVPGGAAAASPNGATAESLAPSSTALTSSAPLASVDPTSRMAQRMTSTSSLGSLSSANRGFGPNLASYLGPTSSPASISPTSSYHSSPVEPLRHDFSIGSGLSGSHSSKGALSGSLFESSGSLIGLGLKAPGRFTTNPSEVPATYQDPPKSRLERLASLSNPSTPRSHSSVDLASQFYGAGAFSNGSNNGLGLSFASTSASTTVPSSTTAQHSRHSSHSSFSSIGSTSSATSSLGFPRLASSSYSPFLPRTDSGSSLSSLGGSPYNSFAPLQPAGGEWLNPSKAKASVLEWDTEGLEDEEDLTFTESTQEYVPTNNSHYGMLEGLGSLSLAIDRSADETPTPLGVQ